MLEPSDGAAATASPAAVVAPAEVALATLSPWAARLGGPLLVPGPVGGRRPRAFLLEARVRGVTPLVRAPWPDDALPARVLLVVERAADAAALGLTVLGTWPPPPSA